METVRLYYHLITNAGSALMLALSTGAGCAILGASVTRTMIGTLTGGVIGLLLGSLGFAHAMWRTHRPQSRNGRLAAYSNTSLGCELGWANPLERSALCYPPETRLDRGRSNFLRGVYPQ
jgi:hypothetical protein